MPRRWLVVLVTMFLLHSFSAHIAQVNAAPGKPHILYGNVNICSEDSTWKNIQYVPLTQNDTQYTIFMWIEELNDQVVSVFRMGDMGDQYNLIPKVSVLDRGPGGAMTGDTAHIYIDADGDLENGNEVPFSEAYLQPGRQPVSLPYSIRENGDYLMVDLYLNPLALEWEDAVFYDIPNTTLILNFNRPIVPELICFDGMGMEVDDSGDWDFELSSVRDLHANEVLPNEKITIDINRAHPTTVNMALAGLVTHQSVDLLLEYGTFTDCSWGLLPGGKLAAVTGADNMRIQMMAYGYVLGVAGDVTGDGEVTAYDASLILRSAVTGSEEVFPVYDAATEISQWLTAQNHPCDVMLETADLSGNGSISAYDAALALRRSVGLPDMAPALRVNPGKCRLSVKSYDGETLSVSIDLDDVSSVYSGDIGMTYSPQTLTLEHVSGTSSVSDWMLDHGTSGTYDNVSLKVSLAGADQPVDDGALVEFSFHVEGNKPLRDVVKQLRVTQFELNGGRAKTTFEALPEAVALMQNYPNPFNPETWIPYQLSEAADVSITVYNVNGRVVKRLYLGNQMPGYYTHRSKAAYWDGRNESGEEVSSGIYFYRLQAGQDNMVRKMIIAK